jgi:hypothetical protein
MRHITEILFMHDIAVVDEAIENIYAFTISISLFVEEATLLLRVCTF